MWRAKQIEFSNLENWHSDDHGAALAAFARQTLRPANEEYATGAYGLSPELFFDLANIANQQATAAVPRAFFEENFVPFALKSTDGNRGQVTAFFEPEVGASLAKTEKFSVPLLRRPQDLLPLTTKNRPAHLNEDWRFGRALPDGTIGEYFDRAAIHAGAINHEELAIAWLEDPVDAFFIHIQGAARLKFENGDTTRITYDGKSGHPFTAIGKLLVERGEIEKAKISMQSIKAWLYAHPLESQSLMEENRSYIFFKTATVEDENLGPIAAAKVPLTPERSLAVDRKLHTFGTPVFLSADRVNGAAVHRLMIAQETGTAIVGPARGDIFFGSGHAAGEAAGGVNSACNFTLLVPKAAAEQFASAHAQ